jgi:TonB family protein
VTDGALAGDALEAPAVHPTWLRPAIITAVVALHAAALSTAPHLAPPKTLKILNEIVVDVQPEPAPLEAPAATPAAPAEASAPPAAPEPPRASAPPPPEAAMTASSSDPVAPMVAAQAPEAPAAAPATPRVVEAPQRAAVDALEPTPAVAAPPPPVVLAPAPTRPRPVELAPSKPVPPLRRVEPPKAPAPKPLARLEPQERPLRAPAARETQASKPGSDKPSSIPPNLAAPAAPSAMSQSGYAAAVSAAIRSRLFYPPAARARGARGVVGVAFTVAASGALATFAVTHSSGDADLDAAARALVESAHFPPPPGGPVHVSTSFNYVPR